MKRRQADVPLPALDAVADEKTAFFMTASHQLKSPLAIIQWCLQSALEDTDLKPATRTMLARAVAQSSGMSHLLTDMLQTLRIVHDQGVARDLVPVDVNAVIHAVIEQYRPVANQVGVHLVKGAIEDLPPILGDEQYLTQAFINLVDNAIKYTSEHGRVEVTACVRKGFVEFQVHDTGIGIADADQGRLFTEFFRSESAKEKAREGTGLGLVLVKHIIESFKGTVTFKSAVHKGTTFTVHLPVSASKGR